MHIATRMTLAAALALASFALAGCACAATTASETEGITVSATSSTRVTPDQARFTVAVQTRDADERTCQARNGEAVANIVEALVAAGVPEENIQTQWTSLNPIFDESTYDLLAYADEASVAQESAEGENDAEEAAAEPNIAVTEDILASERDTSASEPSDTFAGFEMYTSLSIQEVAIDAVDALTAAAVDAGATSVDGAQYYSSEYDVAYESALQQAVDDARAKAQAIADAAGVRLGSIVSITEGYQNTAYRTADGALYAAEESADAVSSIMPGKIDIEAQVTVRFALR